MRLLSFPSRNGNFSKTILKILVLKNQNRLKTGLRSPDVEKRPVQAHAGPWGGQERVFFGSGDPSIMPRPIFRIFFCLGTKWLVLTLKRNDFSMQLLYVFSGKTTFESNRKTNTYHLGWKQNLVEVFGYNWKRALVWPFAASKLPHNGVDWDTTETWKQEGPKNRWGMCRDNTVNSCIGEKIGDIAFSSLFRDFMQLPKWTKRNF